MCEADHSLMGCFAAQGGSNQFEEESLGKVRIPDNGDVGMPLIERKLFHLPVREWARTCPVLDTGLRVNPINPIG